MFRPIRRDDLTDLQAVAFRELEVALVVGGHRHDRARPVGRQHVIGDPDGDALAGECVLGEGAGAHALLDPLRGRALDLLHQPRPGDVLVDLTALGGRGDLRHQRVLRRQDHERRAVDRVRPGGEEEDLLSRMAVDVEGDLRALRAPDPVGLHDADPLRPIDPLEAQQLVGVPRDPEEPLLQIAFDHWRLAALAAPADHLLVREHGLVLGAPVDRRHCPIRQTLLQKPQEHPLVPAVVLRVTGHDLATPVDRSAHHRELLAHVGHVLFGPRRWMHVPLDRRVLGGEAEGVEAHREQHVVTAHPQEARGAVGRRHGVPVTDVQLTRRIRVHRHEVEVRPIGDVRCLVEAGRGPALLPLRLDDIGRVAIDLVAHFACHVRPPSLHRCRLAQTKKPRRPRGRKGLPRYHLS